MSGSTVLLTGGAGYIGSHVAVALSRAGFDPLIIDDFSNSSPVVLDRLATLIGKKPDHIEADLAAPDGVKKIIAGLSDRPIAGVVHLAGLKAVGESVQEPSRYYRVNIGTTLSVLALMQELAVSRIVFSSSATVYGGLNAPPVDETGATGPVNPYGFTKYFNEQIITDQAHSEKGWQVTHLRYFNPVGAHPSGLIGEDPTGVPNNLFPFIAQVAVGRHQALNIYGNDYATKDGTGVRDYIHVADLAEGHVAALKKMLSETDGSVRTYNLGTGQGYSVLEVKDAFEQASGKKIPVKIVPRREGDVAEIFAAPQKAQKELGWRATKTLTDMCTDHWKWQSQNPYGYRDD